MTNVGTSRLGAVKSKLWPEAGEPEEVDHPQKWDKSGWKPSDFELRGEVPIVRDWEVSCGQCGELVFLKLTDAAASAYARQLVREHRRCDRCQGWLNMERLYAMPRETVERLVDAPDSLEGPKYQGRRNPGQFGSKRVA